MGSGVGAAIGGAIGSAILPGVGTAVGTALGAGAQAALAGAGGGWARRKHNKLLKEDLKKMQAGQLGLSQNEQDQIAGQAQMAAAQQGGAAQRSVARDAMASGQSPFVGRAAQLQRDIAGDAAEAGARARVTAAELSRQLAEQRRQEITGRLESEYSRRKQSTAAARDRAGQALASEISAIWEDLEIPLSGAIHDAASRGASGGTTSDLDENQYRAQSYGAKYA